jgi:hypothetical protein
MTTQTQTEQIKKLEQEVRELRQALKATLRILKFAVGDPEGEFNGIIEDL